MNTHPVCPLCGSSITVWILGDLELLKCTACSWEQGSTVSRGEVCIQPPGEPKFVAVKIRWKEERLSNRELIAIRKLLPKLSDVPILILQQRLGQSPEYDLGVMNEWKATELQAAADREGLNVILEMQLQ